MKGQFNKIKLKFFFKFYLRLTNDENQNVQIRKCQIDQQNQMGKILFFFQATKNKKPFIYVFYRLT